MTFTFAPFAACWRFAKALRLIFALAITHWCGTAESVFAQLTLIGPVTRAVYQRNEVDLASIPITGSYTGLATSIEARATDAGGAPITPWHVIDGSPRGDFAGRLSLPAGGWYQIQVRALNGATEIASQDIDKVGVGDVFITAGQSNAANHGVPRQTANDRVSALMSIPAPQWQHANDPQPLASGSDGSPWPPFGNVLVAQNDMPVGIISVGSGGTALRTWLPGETLYNRLRDALQLTGPNGVRAILWHQGESDALENTSTSTYASRLNTIIEQSRIDAGWNVPWGVAIASYHDASTAAQQAAVVAGQRMVIDDDPLVFEGPNTDNFHNIGYLWDNVHFNNVGLQAHGQMWAAAVTSFFAPVPEPTSGLLLFIGTACVCIAIRRRIGRT